MWQFYCIDVEVKSYVFLIHVNQLAEESRIQCDLVACKYCPVVTIIDKKKVVDSVYICGVCLSEYIANLHYE